MVLPTLALAYAVQFIIDTVLVHLAVRWSRKLPGHSSSKQLSLGSLAIALSSRQPAAPVPASVQAQAPASASVAALVQAAPISAAAPTYTAENSQKKAELVVMDERDVKASNTPEHIMKESIAMYNPGAAVPSLTSPKPTETTMQD
ncbi:hypothetical protein FS749_015510 [Ceratobasidium sp. UAMH 11750]|nr:hypothetical protein FS749_015510 [Ceratobasidium sp. UAMH 11750]